MRLGRNVLALSVVSFLTDVATEMTYPLIPIFLSTVLGVRATAVGAIEGAAESTAALLKLASGWLSDRVPRRKPLVLLGYGIASAIRPLIGLAQSAGQVLAIRVSDRVGKGIRTSPRDALIADSVDPAIRGKAFGFHRASDHAGAVVGPLLAFAFLRWGGLDLRHLFLWTAVPGALAVVALIFGVREAPREVRPREETFDPKAALGKRFWAFLVVLFVFTLGNSTDAFLLLRASDLGVSATLIPILWALLHVVKSASSTPGGALSDRLGRKPLLIAGWIVYAVVYFLLGRAGTEWHVWTLFAVYGVYFGLTEGVEKALVADLVPADRRGSAFGWYNLALGLGALPASLIFGAIWDRWGATTAFTFGAAMALVAAIGITVVAPSQAAGRDAILR
ncbi:MAG TPA: MFS transporter [Thermoanaerobaculia bacterium]|jgi:MFS family permease|nr:MFS transporter [Thermoanaerobaculia bacterium]